MLVSRLEEGCLLRFEDLIFSRFRFKGLKNLSGNFIFEVPRRMIVFRRGAQDMMGENENIRTVDVRLQL